jgi:intraflagellar transport protein 172
LIHKAGELSVVEYGVNELAAVVPTEVMSPYLLSVAVRSARAGLGPSGAGAADAVKRLAYLVDLKTIRVVDIMQENLLTAITHESRVDWLVRIQV